MDANELRQTLARLNVTPPEPLRASLYLKQIEDVHDFLFTNLPKTLEPESARFETALQDPDLLNDFCSIIDDFLGPAVSNALGAADNYENYADYFDKNIFGEDFTERVRDFFGTYPATNRAVQRLTTNFKNNVERACTRIQANWLDLDATFPPPAAHITRLLKIKSTGSDFHKGGQQVLILTFALFVIISAKPGGFAMERTLNIVYKPSDLEADCLLVGDSAAVNAVHADFQQASLFEIINAIIAKQQRTNSRLEPLPTYKILPYKWGSSLDSNGDGNLPIRDSYGYLEFLEHRHQPGQTIFNYYPFGFSDFKIFPSADPLPVITKFYQQIGQLLATASSFSITDMHVENVIVSRFQPYLIDLEISLTKLIGDVNQTGFFGDDEGGITALWQQGGKQEWKIVEIPDGKPTLERDFEAILRQNRIWTVKPDEVVNPKAKPQVVALLNGFRDGLTVVRAGVNDANGNRFTSWFQRLDGAIVRYLPVPTATFGIALREIYNGDNSRDLDFFSAAILGLVKDAYRKYESDPTPQPDFVALQEIYTEADLQNCDVPVFYHRIGTLDIMDSRGTTVAIPKKIKIPNRNPPPVRLPLGRDTFFSNLPMLNNVQEAQVNSLHTLGHFNERFIALKETLLVGLRERKLFLPNFH